MRILGIDPGFERLGVAILEKNTTDPKEHVVFSECFKTPSSMPFAERIQLIGAEIREKIKKYRPEILAIETLFLTNNQKTVMRVAEARGVVLYEAVNAGLQIFELSPLQIKMSITGYGRADKKQILKMVKMLVKIEDSKNSDDELDAIAVALAGFAETKNIKRLAKKS